MEEFPGSFNSADDLLKTIFRRMVSLWQERGEAYEDLERRLFKDAYALLLPHGGDFAGSGIEHAFSQAVCVNFQLIWIQCEDLRMAIVNLTSAENHEGDSAPLESRIRLLERLLNESPAWGAESGLQILISSPFQSIFGVREIFSEIINSVSIISGMNPDKRIISEYDMRYNPALFVEPLPRTEIERKLVDHVLNLDFPGACTVMEQIIDYELSLPRTQLSFLPRISKRLEWILIVLRVPRSRGDEKSVRIYNYPHKVYYAANFDECRRLVAEFFNLLDDYYSAFRFSVGKNISQITDYIRDNYSDPNLNAVMICDRFRISQSYLSHMFKQKTGVKLIDFIHMVRSEKIKELLTTTNLTISAIAEMTGYISNGSMTRSFKRCEGQTPSDYREAHQISIM